MARRQDRKDILLEAGLTLAAELSLPIVLQRIVDLAVQVTDARYGALGVLGDNGELIEFVTTGISARERREIGALPRGRGVLGHLITQPRPIRIKAIAKHPRSVGFPQHHPPMTSFLGAPVRAMGKVYGNIYLTEKRGADEFNAEDETSLVILATQAGVAIANASLYEETRMRERWLDALHDITSSILSGAEADSLLSTIAEHARELAHANSASITTATQEPGQLIVAAAVGQRSAEMLGQLLPAARSMSGEVMQSGRPSVVADASTERRAHQPVIRAGRIGPAIFVPLRVRGQATGTLMVANQKGGGTFGERTVRLVETFADQASIAIEYGRARADLMRLGLMEERERIARELHDGIIQSLFAVGMGLQASAVMASSPEVASRMEGAVGELDRVIRDLRNYIFGLRPGILADQQLDQALRALSQEVQARAHIKIDVKIDPAVAALLSSRSHDIVQLTREALSNVSRHAQATHASVALGRLDSNAVLSIDDDGIGFDTARPGGGNGLRNMRERAAKLNGDLHLTSAEGKGTKLRISFPMPS